MDYTTIIGIFAGLVLFVTAMAQGSELSMFIDVPSVLIVLGGTFAATLVNYPFSQVLAVFRVLRIAFKGSSMRPVDAIETIVGLSEVARREGLLALEDHIPELDDEFLKKAIQLVVDGTDPELVREILETELSFLEDRHIAGQSIFETMGSLAPAFGMVGTLIGLVGMLGNLEDPEMIAPGLATALLTTFYGVLMANLLFLPIAGKLKVRSSEEILLKEVMIEGILSIQAGENPRIVADKLKAFLSPQARVDYDGHAEKGVNQSAQL